MINKYYNVNIKISLKNYIPSIKFTLILDFEQMGPLLYEVALEFHFNLRLNIYCQVSRTPFTPKLRHVLELLS